MKLKITSGSMFDNGLSFADPVEPLYRPPLYKDDKPRMYVRSVIVRGVCFEHHFRDVVIDADVEWNDRDERYTATLKGCSYCDAPETEEPPPRVFKAKITRWLGRYGFAVPLRGEADDVDSVFVTAGAVCHHAGTRDPEMDEWSVDVRRGTIVSLYDVRKGARGYFAKEAECAHCVDDRRAREAEEKRLAAIDKRKREAKKRVVALFEKGHKFDVGAEYPYFVKSSNMVTDKVSAAFIEAACKAVYEGADDAAVIAFAEGEARKAYEAYEALRNRSFSDRPLEGVS